MLTYYKQKSCNNANEKSYIFSNKSNCLFDINTVVNNIIIGVSCNNI